MSDYKAGYTAGRKNESIPANASEDWLDGYVDGQLLEFDKLHDAPAPADA